MSSSRSRPVPSPAHTTRKMCVYDFRSGKQPYPSVWLETAGINYEEFLRLVKETFPDSSHKSFVLHTTERTPFDSDKFMELKDGSIIYMFRHKNQALPLATEQRIQFTPHHDTLIDSGSYEYYASSGQTALPYTLAELVDNALSATAKNKGTRIIEIRMLFDETLGKPAIIVLDNGCGMTSKQLNNWAIYRLSKFKTEGSSDGESSMHESYVRPKPVPRSLNSDISYFGVGGKQAVFYIGESARMITKSVTSPDVHELVLSKEDFERKVKNKEDVYSGIIINRTPGDSSRVSTDETHFLCNLIAEEPGKKSFTAVVITEVKPEHIISFKKYFSTWTRQLAHTYHYYIHGENGNDLRSDSTNSNEPKIEIQITLQEKNIKAPRVLNLREIDNDMQTLYINAAADTFEFKAWTQPDGGTVEGIIRYHPYLYDRETYPEHPDASCAPIEDDDFDEETGVLQPIKKKPIFECYWNGRLIPYTTVAELDWCARPSKGAKLPVECYNRISGVLFTDDNFQVTTNKLTFMELEMKLRNRETIFSCSVNGQRGQRVNIQKDFTQWLQNCHEKWDKQVKFLNYKGTITRTDVAQKKMQHPWAIFNSVEWDSREYRVGQYVKSQKTKPIIYGTVVQFLLHGDYDGDVFAPGGLVEVCLEPRALYNKTKIMPLFNLDKNASQAAIKANIESDLAKLPQRLEVSWPESKPWPVNATRPAGTQFGPLRVDILNACEESMSRMPSLGQGTVIKLTVELKVVRHRPAGDEEVVSCVAQYSASWGYWFKKIENLVKIGKYTLHLRTMISETNETVFGDKELPCFALNFNIKEGSAEMFDLGTVSSSVHVGKPFDIPLKIKDAYGHSTVPPPDVKPVLECSGLDLTYAKVQSSRDVFIIQKVRARGKVLNYQHSKTYDLKVTLPGLTEDTKSFKISLLPGDPHSIQVTPEDAPITVENGNSVQFDVAIHDEAGNITAHPKLIARCRVAGFPAALIDCSRTGVGQYVTQPIKIEIKGKPETVNVKFDIPSYQSIASVTRELNVEPSTRVCRMDIICKNEGTLVLKNNEKIEWLAGGIVENLFYELYDEGNRKVAITPAIASKIKVNWTSDGNLKDREEGELPDIHVPTRVQDERFYQVSYQDQSISASFFIVPCPDEPSRLKATLSQNTARLGEPMLGDIILDLLDQYENVTKTFTSTCVNDIAVEAEGLNQSALALTWQKSSCSVLVTGVCFQSGTLGPREMSFTFKSFVEKVKVNMTPGVPSQLKLVSGPKQPLQVFNDHSIPTPFLVQLYDKWENPTGDQRVVVHLKWSPQTLKVKANVTSQPVNAEGKASFIVNSVSGPKGYYQLSFEGLFNSKPVLGPSVNLTVINDPNKPVSLSVNYDTNVQYPAGGVFPVFSVTVVSEEGSPVTNFNKAAATMLLWKGVQSGRPCQAVNVMNCSKPMENEEKHCIHFRDKCIPEELGVYTIQFSLKVERGKELQSDPIIINVVANDPVQLRPEVHPATPVVSHSTEVANRTLVEDLTLIVMDEYGNPAGKDLNGEVLVSIKDSDGEYNSNLPLLEGGTNCLQFMLYEGKTHISKLTIMENSPGENGSTYIIHFEPVLQTVLTVLAPFELPFHFYNDSETQQRMAELSKRKDVLKHVIATQKAYVNSFQVCIQSVTDKYMTARNTEASLRHDLNMRHLIMTDVVSTHIIDELIRTKAAEAERIERTPRRKYPFAEMNKEKQQDGLGKVGNLATVEDDDAAWVISWYICSSMDCVVTMTTAEAKNVYRRTYGKQQVMALDGVYISGSKRPLPHIRNGRPLFNPPGNPVFARDLLKFSNYKEQCDIVFRNLLGETIVMDDLDSANTYRHLLVQNRISCPTILTKQGDRISAKGIWGGAQNRAPPRERLRMFGAPLPQSHDRIIEEMVLLERYKSELKKYEEARSKYDEFLRRKPEIQQKREEMAEKTVELEEVEKQLASTPVRCLKRVSMDAAGPSDLSKRPRHGRE